MTAQANGHSRRSVLKRAAILAAGAVGLSAATGKEANATMLPPPGGTGSFRLEGINWRIAAPDRKPGAAIPLGEHAAIYGDLVDGRTQLGRFYGSRLAVQSTPGGHAQANASVEVHTFVLPAGTIVGMGTSILGRATFAIVGGTGAYAGATGSYAANQRLRELGGDGTADFVLDLRV
ncbi:MAG TPA: hypothetical protein VFA30_00815 [Gaiellaceae bacterium]|nr:hypothetical protein [Gaiellaceae bacterium]